MIKSNFYQTGVTIGDELRIIHMEGEPAYTGKSGRVKFIDSIGQIHGTWGGLALDPEVDQFIIIKKKEESND